jgi:DNA-binding response OmpR family regulator
MMKILIVDDNEDFRMLCRYELEDAGYEIIMAGTAAGAMESFRKEKPDLVVLDIKLPDMDGLELLGRIKEVNNAIPVIMHTAFDYMYDLACGSSEAYVVKSSDFRELKEAISRLTKESNTMQAEKQEDKNAAEEFTRVSIEIRQAFLKRLGELGGRDKASLSRMLDEAVCAYLRNTKSD